MLARTDKENTPIAAELRSRSARAKRSAAHNVTKAKTKINFIERNRLAAGSSAPSASKVNAHGRGDRGLSERDRSKSTKAKIKSNAKTSSRGRTKPLPTSGVPAADAVASRTRSRSVRTRKAAPPAVPPVPVARSHAHSGAAVGIGVKSTIAPAPTTTRMSMRLATARDKTKAGIQKAKATARGAAAKGMGTKSHRHAAITASPGSNVGRARTARVAHGGHKAAARSTPKATRRLAPAMRSASKSPLIDTMGVTSSAADSTLSGISPQQKRALRTSPPKLAGDTLSVPVLAIDLMHEREECEAVMSHEGERQQQQEEFVEDAGALAEILGDEGASDPEEKVTGECAGTVEADANDVADTHEVTEAVRPARARRARIRHAPLTPGSCRRGRHGGDMSTGAAVNAADVPKCGLAAEIRREGIVQGVAPANAAAAQSVAGVGARRAALRAAPKRNKLKFRKRLQEAETREQEAAREEQRRGSIYAAPRRVIRANGKGGKSGTSAAKGRGAPVVQLDVQAARARNETQAVADARQQANAMRAASRGRVTSRNVRALQRDPESESTGTGGDAEPALDVERDALDLLGDEADISNEVVQQQPSRTQPTLQPVTIVHTSPRQLCRTLARPLAVSPSCRSACELQDQAAASIGLGASAFAEAANLAAPEPLASPSRDELEEAETVGLRNKLSGHVMQSRFDRPKDPLATTLFEQSETQAEAETGDGHQGSETGMIPHVFTSDCCSTEALTRTMPVARRVPVQGQAVAPSNGTPMQQFGVEISMSEKLARARAELESERSKNAAMGFCDTSETSLDEPSSSTLSAGMGLASVQIGVASSWSSSCSGGSFGSGDFQTFALTALAQEKESDELLAEAQPLNSPCRSSAAEAMEAVEFSPSAPELEMALGSADHVIAGRSPSRTEDLPRLFNPVATVLFGNQSPAAQQPQRTYGDNSPLQARVLSMSGDRNVTNPKATLCSAQAQQVSQDDDDGEYNSDTFELDDTE